MGNVLANITLDDAITAQKALEAAAVKYRGIAADLPAGHVHVRVYIDRAVSCEKVAAVLLRGATVE